MIFLDDSFPDSGFDPSMDPMGSSGSGIPGFFIFFVVLAIGLGIVTTIVRVSQARRMAERAGMDPGEATAMTLLSEDGLSATYLASNLKGPAQPAAPTPGKTTAERLAELSALKDSGAITEAEYVDRRRAIIDSV